MKTALITGASSGIGAELAKLFAADGYNLILVARNESALNILAREITSQSPVEIAVFPRDLSQPHQVVTLYEEVIAKGYTVDALVNNAGFGLYGKFIDTKWERELEMINLNILALTHLTKLFLPHMVSAGHGRILNVASTAAFQPGPLMAVYYATKAYVLLLSEAIGKELEGTGVSVTALCPGPTKSGFQKAAEMEKSKLIKGVIADPASVAKAGYVALMKQEPVVITGFINKMLALSVRFLPRKLVTTLSQAAAAPR